jgi:hypothetical protein
MKTKLMNLNLPETLVDKILKIFDEYIFLKKEYDKPKGIKSFEKHLTDIIFYSENLQRELKKLSAFECRLLSCHNPLGLDIRKLKDDLYFLSLACDHSKKKNVKSALTKKEPFTRYLTEQLWAILDKNNIPVTLYRDNIICKILDILLDADQDSERSFNLVREVSKRMLKE